MNRIWSFLTSLPSSKPRLREEAVDAGADRDFVDGLNAAGVGVLFRDIGHLDRFDDDARRRRCRPAGLLG